MNIHLKYYYYNVNSSNSRYLKYNKLLGQNEIESTLIIESRLDLFYLRSKSYFITLQFFLFLYPRKAIKAIKINKVANEMVAIISVV